MDNLKKMHDMLNAARSVLGLDLTLDELKATKKEIQKIPEDDLSLLSLLTVYNLRISQSILLLNHSSQKTGNKRRQSTFCSVP